MYLLDVSQDDDNDDFGMPPHLGSHRAVRTDSDNERNARRRLNVNNGDGFEDDEDDDDDDDEDAPPMLGNRMRAQMRSTQLGKTTTAPSKKPFSMEVIDF